MSSPLVSVIVPAYNGAPTLRQTINSVQRQSYSHLEIIIVDDGSTDGTSPLAAELAASDPRIMLIRTKNGGVAKARNRAIGEATSDYIAPVDADDLWHPTKIEKQLAPMLHNADVGFVYSFYRHIDANGHVLGSANPFVFRGHVFCQHLMRNFVGNASAPLMRRSAILQAGGYDPRLRDLGAQGCEDLLLQLRIARHWRVECIPEYLVGYRQLGDRMSADTGQMFRSQMLVLDMLRHDHPEIPSEAFRWSEAALLFKYALQQWPARRWRSARYLAAAAVKDPEMTCRKLGGAVVRRAKRTRHAFESRSGSRHAGLDFEAIEPTEAAGLVEERTFGKRLLLLREMDRRFLSAFADTPRHGSRTDRGGAPITS